MVRIWSATAAVDEAEKVTILLDTHFLIWITTRSKRVAEFPWIERYRPWAVSPVSFLEIQYLAEVGRLEVRSPDYMETVMEDPRFIVDEVPLVRLIRASLALDWTRDPFDRLLCAHSLSRRVPFCSVDQIIRTRHQLIVPELAS